MAILLDFRYIILSFKNSQEHPLLPGHQTMLLALDMADEMEVFAGEDILDIIDTFEILP